MVRRFDGHVPVLSTSKWADRNEAPSDGSDDGARSRGGAPPSDIVMGAKLLVGNGSSVRGNAVVIETGWPVAADRVDPIPRFAPPLS